MSEFKDYLHFTRSPFYSILSIIPVFIIYEAGLFIVNHSDVEGIRNGADVLLRQFFALFNISGFYASGLLAIILLLFSAIHQFRKGVNIPVRVSFLLLLFLESSLYAFLFYYLSHYLFQFYLAWGKSSEFFQMLALSFGAGLYEELIFRVILITGFFFLLHDLFRWTRLTAAILSILLSAILFSLFHFVGSYGDDFTAGLFLFRLLAGVYLSSIYYLRGFGIVVYTHAIYDLLIVFSRY